MMKVTQHSTMLMNNQTGSYTWSNISGNMDYQSITVNAPGGNTITINVSGYEFQFSMNPFPNIPTTYAGIVATGTNW